MSINLARPTELNGLWLPESSEPIRQEEDTMPSDAVDFPDVFTFDYEHEDYRRYILLNMGRIALKTREAATKARSWRGFTVGVTAVAVDLDGLRLGFFTGGNVKDEEENPTNCGETNTLLPIVEHFKMERIAAFFIAATNDADKIKGVNVVPSRTLHPCKHCGKSLKNSDVVDNETLLYTFGKNINIAQALTVKQYDNLYKKFRKTGNINDYKEPDAYRLRLDDDEGEYLAESYSRSVRRLKIGGGEFHGDKGRIKKRNQEMADTITRESIFYNN